LGSLALHGLFALLLLFVAPKLITTPRPVESTVPVEIVELAPPASPAGEIADGPCRTGAAVPSGAAALLFWGRSPQRKMTRHLI